MTTPRLAAVAAILVVAGAVSARAAEMNENDAKSKMESAGYADVSRLHEANAGEWMADATKDGRPVMITLYPDGRVAPREQVDVPPAKVIPPGSTPNTPPTPAAKP